MQLLAMLTMLVDHIGKAFYPDQLEWQIIGRIAFPLYAYCIVLGYRYTKSLKNYMLRLLIIAIMSQYPYMLVFDTMGLNVVGTLLMALIVLMALDRYKGTIQATIIVSLAGFILESLNFSYGIYGLLLVLIYHFSRKHTLVALHVLLNVMFMYLKGWYISMLNIFPTILIAYLPLFYVYIGRIPIPRWIWRSFYPAHLTILALFLYMPG
jgi:hypothetical protein